MSFRENLKFELESRDIKVKELAQKTEISENTLKSYLKNASSEPIATNAVKIAKVLNVSVEYLVTGNDSKKDNELLRKYKATLQALEKIPQKPRESIEKMILELSDSLSAS